MSKLLSDLGDGYYHIYFDNFFFNFWTDENPSRERNLPKLKQVSSTVEDCQA